MTTPDAQALFRRHFGYAPTHVIRAPGHVELLGEHRLCGDGLVVSAAINKYVSIASTPRSDGKVELISPNNPKPEIFWASGAQPNIAAPWADGVKRAISVLRKRGVSVSGFGAAIADDMPTSADFGRGVAAEIATVLTLRQLFPFGLGENGLTPPPARNAKGQLPPLSAKEKLHFSKLEQLSSDSASPDSSALLGSLSSYFGKAWHVLNVDLRFRTAEVTPLTGEALVICDAGATSGSTPESASEIKRLCASAAAHLGAKSLRSVELDWLKAGKSKLTPREYDCAAHVAGEMARVVGGERALRDEDHRQFGQFMLQSHDSERDLLKSVSPDVEFLVKLARTIPGCLGARRCQAASSAATINLVSYHQAEGFMKLMAQQYESRLGRKLQTYVLQMTDGAS